MKGVILAGGKGTRLRPLTVVANKQLLPVYNKPLIFYPFNILLKAGIEDVLIVSSPEYIGNYVRLFESGRKYGIHVTYAVQESPDGLAHGLSLAEDFADGGPVTMILGDNIFEDSVHEIIQKFNNEGMVNFFVEVPNPQQLGCPVFDDEGKIIRIEEKPKEPKSKFAQTGLYIYDKSCFDKIRQQKPSARGELEITDLNNMYLTEGKMKYEILKGKWFDAGSFDALLEASNWAKDIQIKDATYIHNLL